jgi:cold shock CspA family protein
MSGVLKFFYANESYGFLVGDLDGCDIFFHIDDLLTKNISKEYLA